MSWSSLRPGGGAAPLIAHIPGANDQPHTIINHTGPFLQEDQPAQFAAVINSFINTTTREHRSVPAELACAIHQVRDAQPPTRPAGKEQR